MFPMTAVANILDKESKWPKTEKLSLNFYIIWIFVLLFEFYLYTFHKWGFEH